MTLVLALIAGIAFVEILLRSPLKREISQLQRTASQTFRVLRSSAISDHWKEKVLLAYSGRLLRSSLVVGLSVIAAVVPLIVLIGLGDLIGADVGGYVMSLGGIALLTVVSGLYAWWRMRQRTETGDYGFGARLLHRLALGSDAVAEMSFDLQQRADKAAIASTKVDRPVFVAGLARAGTTILMRRIYESGRFRSLTYRDMPFVLAPNLWRRLSAGSRQETAAKERAHGDSILVDFDSPEALEEVFWRVFCGEDYIRPERLVPMTASDEVVGKFRGYVASILSPSPDKRYLSKNNNNILRLPSLIAAFPDAVVLVPFRDPLQQAASLMRQHLRFTGEAKAGDFTARYMTWLVHHEFGADQRPFVFEGAPPSGDPARDLDYWVALWIETYRHLLQRAPDSCNFVCYERLCADPAAWDRLVDRLGIDKTAGAPFVQPKSVDVAGVSAELASRARELYAALEARVSPT